MPGMPERMHALANACAARRILIPAARNTFDSSTAEAPAVPQFSVAVRMVGRRAFDQVLQGKAHHSPATDPPSSHPNKVFRTAGRDKSN